MLVITSGLWSTSGVLVKALSWQPVSILAGRGIFTSIVFLLYMRQLPKKTTHWTLLAAGGSIATQILFVTSTKLNRRQRHFPAIYRTDLCGPACILAPA